MEEVTNSLSTSLAKPEESTKMTSYDYATRMKTMSLEERDQFRQISSKIKIGDMSSISQYGHELSAIISQNGDTLLDSVHSSSSNEVIGMVTDLLKELNTININDLDQSGFKGFLRKIPILNKLVRSIESIKLQYNTVLENVTAITSKISQTKICALTDNGTLDIVYNNNVSYINQLRELIIAAKVKEQDIAEQIENMQINAAQYDAYEINDATMFKNALAKRISDMITTEYVLYQNLFQIRAIQTNNNAIADKSDNIVNHILPLWKGQILESIILDNQKANVDAQKLITDTTNRLMIENSKKLKINSISVAKATEESIISLETLRDTTRNLIDTAIEVKKIHSEAAKNRENIEKMIGEFRNNFEKEITA